MYGDRFADSACWSRCLLQCSPTLVVVGGGQGGVAHLLIFRPNTQILQMYPALHMLEFARDENLCSRMGARKKLVFYRPEERKKESSFSWILFHDFSFFSRRKVGKRISRLLAKAPSHLVFLRSSFQAADKKNARPLERSIGC